MASSKKSRRRTEPAAALLSTALADALHASTRAAGRAPLRVAVAYSGGADSTALLHVTAAFHHRGDVRAFAFHVHHALSQEADAWLAHCAAVAARLDIDFDSEHVAPKATGMSIEAEARRWRYAALARLCTRYDVDVLMTAHHADDQAETVLLNLARGAGIAGLAATARARALGKVTLLRPWLAVPAESLRAYVRDNGFAHVEDASNADRRYTRNALRHEVMPALRRLVPSIATRLAQTAAHAATMQTLLDEIGHEDLHGGATAAIAEPSAVPHDLDVEALRRLSRARAANALRTWLQQRAMRAPSVATLNEMLDQLLLARPDAQIALLHEQETLRIYRGRVSIEAAAAPRPSFESLIWRGEDIVEAAGWAGSLHFVRNERSGFDESELLAGPLSLRERRGGERLRTHAGGPSRTLKNLYQERGIPAWQRRGLPLVYLGDRLLYAAGIGANAAMLVDGGDGGATVMLEWRGKA